MLIIYQEIDLKKIEDDINDYKSFRKQICSKIYKSAVLIQSRKSRSDIQNIHKSVHTVFVASVQLY